MLKYGFVYLWYDKKHKRYYIGCHWGREDDGYICSSRWMRKAYRRRPHDFKRRILVNNILTTLKTHEIEKRWLALIKDEELKVRYYNMTKNTPATYDSYKNSSRSETIKKCWQNPEYVKKRTEAHIKGMNTEEYKEKMRQRTTAMWQRKEHRDHMKKVHSSKEYLLNQSVKHKEVWNNKTEEQKQTALSTLKKMEFGTIRALNLITGESKTISTEEYHSSNEWTTHGVKNKGWVTCCDKNLNFTRVSKDEYQKRKNIDLFHGTSKYVRDRANTT